MAAESDPFLPIAPARVKALVLPIGNIKPARFATFLERLTSEHVVHLRDVTPDSRPNRNMFSPLAFPSGAIFYDLVTHVPSPSHLALAPFDLYRQPLVIIAVADGLELANPSFCKRQSAGGRSTEERNVRALTQELEDLRDEYSSRILVYQAMIFDYTAPESGPIPMPEGIVAVPPVEQSKRTTMKTVMCDISSLLLAEMETMARSFEGMSFIDSPGQSSQAKQLNGQGWENDPAAMSRRNSQFAAPTHRSSSATGALDRNQARMSMPVMPKGAGAFSSSSSTPARPSTPVKSGLSNPPTNFDDISNGGTTDPSSPEQTDPRPGTSEGFRTQSQDRISVQGFGPGGLNDRWRNKMRGRLSVVVGSLYLQAGRWTDALKELIDGATVAKSINDHLWHGKALDLIVVTLILLGFVNIEFTVPTVCMPLHDKGNTSLAQAHEAAEKADPEQPKWLRTLQVILPELMDRIIALYSRISAEHLPPLPLSETTLRFCKLLTSLHVCDGSLGREAFQALIFGTLPDKVLTTSPRITIVPSRTQIVNTLFRAFPSTATELLTTIDRIVILSGIASVLGVLGFQRKKAMVVRELISVLIGGLVEARTRGAADVGIHPAAGLVGLNSVSGQTNGAAALDLAEDDIESGLERFLELLLDTYGVVGCDMGNSEEDQMSDDAAVARIQRQAKARAFGMQSIKLNILRACINFSEALPDFNGVLKFSSDLLRTAGSGVAPGPRREDASASLTREEQVRLMTNISKTSSLSQNLGFGDIRAEYWDEFLLRGVKLEPLSPSRIPVAHKKSELPGASASRASQDVDPFLHNPFLKPAAKAVVDQTLVAGEPACFKLTLQNPYDIEVDVESVQLDCEGATFESDIESTIIGPYRTQVMRISGTPTSAGSLQITGAHIQIRGCRKRRFPIFPQPWSPESELKIKAIGLPALSRHLSDPASSSTPPKPEHVGLNVISAQPTIVVKSCTLPQSSVMILEGERRTFSVTLQNISATTPADFLLFSFRDSTQEALQEALSRRDASPAELYEYELILAKKQALRIKQRKGEDQKGPNNNSRFIGPGEEATFDFEILGKPCLTDGTIQVDYARLGMPPDEIETPNFWTRRVSLGLTITVNASVEVVRMDMLPLNGSIPQSLWSRSARIKGELDGSDGWGNLTADEYCLLVLDLRNAWPAHMAISLNSSPRTPESPTFYTADITEQILPGNSSRIVLPLRRIHVADPHAPIPALNPARQRQFVVSTTAPDAERSVREAFWYRERILDGLRGEWRTIGGQERKGTLELRAMKLAPRMIEAIRVDNVGIELTVEDPASATKDGSTTTIHTDEFLQLRVKLTNRGSGSIRPIVRITPSLCHRPPNVALDHIRKFAWNGAMQQALGEDLKGGETRDLVLGVTPLCRGAFEITASVEEMALWEDDANEEKKSEGTRDRLDRKAVGKMERRIWHSRQPCRLVVVDKPWE